MMTFTLSGREAGAIATRGRQLLRRGLITHAQHSLLDVVLWAARRPGSATLIASLGTLACLAGQARSTATAGIAALERLGLLQRIRRRVRVAWAGSVASRVVANGYRLVAPSTETDRRSAREQKILISIVEAPIAEVRAARDALETRRKAIEESWRGRRVMR